MTKESKSKKAKNGAPDLDDEQVKQWLIAHPEFLENNTDLVTDVISANRVSGEGIVDMQSFLVERLQKEVAELKSTQSELVSATRSNLQTQTMVFESIRAILQATNLAHFVHILTQDLPEILDVDVITLCVEDGSIPLPTMTGLQKLKKGNIDKARWDERNILMRPAAPKSKAVFGPAMELVASDALIKLEVPVLNSPAMLAIGSREVGHFHPEQATDLLSFFGYCVQSTLRMWVEQVTAS